jgi:Protein of unknown function (DUF4238)
MADNVKQHVVPRFYIAFFRADAEGMVFVRRKGSRNIDFKSPKGQGYEYDAFTIMNDNVRDTSCDNANKAIEDWCAPRLTGLTAGTPPTDDQWLANFYLTANLICRSRWARDHHVWQVERARRVMPTVNEFLRELPPLPGSVRHFGLSPDEQSDVPGLLDRAGKLLYPLTAALGAVPVAKRLKAGNSCDLLLAPAGSTFITSDEPALILERGEPAMIKIAYGYLARPDIQVYLPLKPNIACLWSAASGRVVRPVTGDEAAAFNKLIWGSCYERVFASCRSGVEDL